MSRGFFVHEGHEESRKEVQEGVWITLTLSTSLRTRLPAPLDSDLRLNDGLGVADFGIPLELTGGTLRP